MLTTSKILLTLAALLLGGVVYASHGHSGGHGFKQPSFSCKAR